MIIEPGVIPHLQPGSNLRVPDLAVTCSELEVRQNSLIDPVLIAEVLSPSNLSETWNNICAYMTIPSAQDILVVRSVFVGADLMHRRPDVTWPSGPEQIRSGDLVLDSVGPRTPLHDLYRRTPLWRPPAA